MSNAPTTSPTAEQFEEAARRFLGTANPSDFLPAHKEWDVSTDEVPMTAAVDDDGNLWVGCPNPDESGEWLHEAWK